MDFWHLLLFFLLLLVFVVGVFALFVMFAMATTGKRQTNYLDGGIDLVDEMTQEQFGRYLTGYFEHDGYAVTPLSQDEVLGTTLLLYKSNEKRFVFAKRSRRAVPDTEVTHALNTTNAAQATDRLIVTNCVLFRDMDKTVKEQGVTVWDRERLIPLMGKAKAKRFAVQAIIEE